MTHAAPISHGNSGVILDEHLTWKNHYNLLKIRSQKISGN